MKFAKTAFFGLLAASVLMTTLSTTAHAETWQQKHGRRAEVMRRDRHEMHRDRFENSEINHDKGHLGGHYNQLKHEDQRIAHQDARIHRQEQWDAAHHHGHITKAEQRQLNREESHVHHEENGLQNQINHDDHP